MLGMLMKHEFRATGRKMLPMLGILTLLGLLANLSLRILEQGFRGGLVTFLLVLFIIAFFVGITVAWVMALVVMISRFYRNLLGDEGYLMFTLPTDTHALIWSKLIVSTVWFLLTSLLTVLLIFLTVANVSHMSADDFGAAFYGFGEVLDMLRSLGVKDSTLVLLGAELILSAVLSCLGTCLHFYAAMSLGQMAANRKALFSVLAFIGISLVFQILGGIFFSGVSRSGSLDLVISQIEDLAQTAPGMFRVANRGIGSGMLLSVLQSAVLYVVTALSLKKKLNLA